MSKRLAFIHELLFLLQPTKDAEGVEQRVWYLWGGKEPETGLDCSGLVTHCLLKAGGPDWRKTHWSGRLWRELPPTDKPQPGDLAFYGSSPKDISHVMVVLESGAAPGSYVVAGASGGNSDTTSTAVARIKRAFVKRKLTHLYRPGFRGFRRLVPLDT